MSASRASRFSVNGSQPAQSAPVFAPDAEKSVLGGMLLDEGKAIPRVRDLVKEHHFFAVGHQILFRALCDVHDAQGLVDVVLLQTYLADAGELESVGGIAFLAELWDFVPTAANIEYHAQIVAQKARERKLIDLSKQLVGNPSDPILQGTLAQLLSEAPASNGSRFTIKRLLEGEPPSPPELAVDQFLLAADINVFGGDGGAGKSTSSCHLAISMITGRPLFGSLNVRRKGPVVMIVPEDGEAVVRHHVAALMEGWQEPLTSEERAAVVRDLHILGDSRPVNLISDTAELAKAISAIGPVLVIADPIASLIGGENEDSEGVAIAVCDNVRRHLCRPTGIAVIFAGHLRKPGRDGGDIVTVNDLKGSKGWSNHSRMVWLVSKPKGGDVITFRRAKANRLQIGVEYQAKLQIEADPENAAHWLRCSLTDVNLGAASQSYTPGVGRAINDNERRALEALDDKHEPGLRLSYSAWLSQSGISSGNTFKGIRGRLLDAGLATAIPTGKKTRTGGLEYAYAISEGGRSALIHGWKNGL